GLQICICFYGLAVFLETPAPLRKGRAFYIVTSFVLLATSTLAMAFTGVISHNAIQVLGSTEALIASETDDWTDIMSKMPTILNLFTITLADGVLLLRCYVFWKTQWLVLAVPALAYIGAIGVLITTMTISATGLVANGYLLQSLSTLSTVVFNVTATSLIIIRLTTFRRRISALLQPSVKRSLYSGPVAILIESALPLAIFGFLFSEEPEDIDRYIRLAPAALRFTATQERVASILQTLHETFAVLAPQLIIFRVTTGRS
ncbi:hypothetical protein FA15DRAFT_557659, partial [Coprinopsis marcescibilis]